MFPLGWPPQGDVARFDVIAESLRRTNLGLLQPGSDVNFERAAKVRRGRCEGAAVLGWQRGCGQQPVAAPERVCLPPGLWLALTTHTPQLLCARCRAVLCRQVGDEIGGHNVSGHVHTVAEIVSVERTEDNRRLEFKVSVAGIVTGRPPYSI